MAWLESIIKYLACISLVIGAVECFAGFKIMKFATPIWACLAGIVLGGIIGVAVDSTLVAVMASIILGVSFALLSCVFYFAGIFTVSSFCGAVSFYLICDNTYFALLVAMGVGLLSVYFVRYTLISSSAIFGSGVVLLSAYCLMSIEMRDNPIITAIVWIPMATVGIFVQFITSPNIVGAKAGIGTLRKKSSSVVTISERKYPGMQRAYRNFCIKCGCELLGSKVCPICKYRCDD